VINRVDTITNSFSFTPETRRRLEVLARAQGRNLSNMVTNLIDNAYQALSADRRQAEEAPTQQPQAQA
jgi:predicted DNA-binding protein